jgi:transcriptional regulator with XRE-family HTH domain
MKERLVQLLDLEQLTPSKFADIIGVQRSSVSHVISGRNKPSFDFLQKTLKAFPGLNADWLMLGGGTMYDQMGRDVSGNLFATPSEPAEASFPDDLFSEDQDSVQNVDSEEAILEPQAGAKIDPIPTPDTDKTSKGVSKEDSMRKIVQVMVFYDDDTFKSFGPSQ